MYSLAPIVGRVVDNDGHFLQHRNARFKALRNRYTPRRTWGYGWGYKLIPRYQGLDSQRVLSSAQSNPGSHEINGLRDLSHLIH
jgi:hypothetical protein